MTSNIFISNDELFNCKILLIDDEQINIDLMTDLLEDEGYHSVSSNTSPLQGIEQYKNNNFDLILLDINMPELDGFGFMQEMQQIKKLITTPVLILTAANNQDICNRALTSGAADYLNKPFDTNEALHRIKNILFSQVFKKRLLSTNEYLEREVGLRTQEHLKTKLKVIEHLGFAAEYRDTETAAHTIRVGEYAKLLGEKCGLDKARIDLLHHAAPLHDIGKIGIPDSILLKPGKFEPDEWKIMKTHATIGAEILQNDEDPLIVMARIIALTHHEKFNGEGYPHGLKGKDIPIEGRIVMLADVYDALTMVRPYKKAWTIEETTALIVKESGTSFDPEIVEVFLSLQQEFMQIRQIHSD